MLSITDEESMSIKLLRCLNCPAQVRPGRELTIFVAMESDGMKAWPGRGHSVEEGTVGAEREREKGDRDWEGEE